MKSTDWETRVTGNASRLQTIRTLRHQVFSDYVKMYRRPLIPRLTEGDCHSGRGTDEEEFIYDDPGYRLTLQVDGVIDAEYKKFMTPFSCPSPHGFNYYFIR